MMTTLRATVGVECEADFAIDQVHHLVVFEFEVDDAVLSEAGDALAGFGVERDQAVAGGYVEDAFLATVGPIGEASTGELARGCGSAFALVFGVDPFQFAGGGVHGDYGSAGTTGGVEHASDHEGVASSWPSRLGPEVIGFETPGYLEAVEVCRVDLR